jgi:hypothetical protein
MDFPIGFRSELFQVRLGKEYIDSAWHLVKPSPPNFVRPLLFSHFMSSNLHVFVSRIVMAKIHNTSHKYM